MLVRRVAPVAEWLSLKPWPAGPAPSRTQAEAVRLDDQQGIRGRRVPELDARPASEGLIGGLSLGVGGPPGHVRSALPRSEGCRADPSAGSVTTTVEDQATRAGAAGLAFEPR